MIRKNEEQKIDRVEQMCGGAGTTQIKHFTDGQDYKGRSSLLARVTLNPGDSVGYHVHEGEEELYHILSGTAKYDDNGKETVILSPGDTTITVSGEGHSIENVGDDVLEFIAVILLYHDRD